MTIIEIVLVLAWILLAIFFPKYDKQGLPTSKPVVILLSAIAVAVLIPLF